MSGLQRTTPRPGIALTMATADLAEAFTAFRDKRPPAFGDR